jgi:hypothetical protein
MPRRTGQEFVWTDDEVELLLNVVSDYKSKKVAECVDWESVMSKYSDIHTDLLAGIPDENVFQKDLPHKKEQITKQIVTSKLKAIRTKYRQAVDSGRRSGHGRVVLLFYELCEVWAGSPATEQIEGGCETADLMNLASNGQSYYDDHLLDSEQRPSSSSSHQLDHANTDHDNPTRCSEEENDDEGNEDSNNSSVRETERNALTSMGNGETVASTLNGEEQISSSVHQQRRQLLDSKLDNYRQQKLKRKLPINSQLLTCAKEELKVKKRVIEKMDEMDKRFTENISQMTKSMEKLTNSIADGFSLLKTFMSPGPISHYQLYGPPQSYYPSPMGSPPLYQATRSRQPQSTYGGSSSDASCPQSPYDLNASGMLADD